MRSRGRQVVETTSEDRLRRYRFKSKGIHKKFVTLVKVDIIKIGSVGNYFEQFGSIIDIEVVGLWRIVKLNAAKNGPESFCSCGDLQIETLLCGFVF